MDIFNQGQLNPRRKLLGKKFMHYRRRRNEHGMTPYGITHKQLDELLLQMCQLYNYQWSVVAAALQKEHHIVMPQAKIKDRFKSRLDPSLNNRQFTYQEEKDILNMFFLKGYKYATIRNHYPDRGPHMFRALIDVHVRHVIRNIEMFLWRQIQSIPPDDQLAQSETGKGELIRRFVAQSRVQWEHNKAFFKILYFFMVSKLSNYDQIPKQLGMIVYKRLVEIKKELQVEKNINIKKIDRHLTQFPSPCPDKQKMKKNRQIRILEAMLKRQGHFPKQKPKKPRKMSKKVKDRYQSLDFEQQNNQGTLEDVNKLHYTQDLDNNDIDISTSFDASVKLMELSQGSLQMDFQCKVFSDESQQQEDYLYGGLKQINLGNVQIQVSKLPAQYSK